MRTYKATNERKTAVDILVAVAWFVGISIWGSLMYAFISEVLR